MGKNLSKPDEELPQPHATFGRFDPDGSLPRGWLSKEGHIFKNWKNRYFAFMKGHRGELSYLDDVDGNVAGTISMNGSTLLEFDEDPLQFGIQEAGGTVYLLKAQSRGEVEAWIHGLAQMAGNEVIQMHVPEEYKKNNDIIGALVRSHSTNAQNAYAALLEHQATLKDLALNEEFAAEDKKDELFIHTMKAQGNMKEEDFMEIFNQADDEGKVELLRLLVKLDEAIPPAVLEGYKEIGIGCYLTCDELNQGTLYTHWSKTKIEGALAYFQPPPERKVPEHKFKSGSQGKNQFVKQIRGPMIQNYYKGWTMFAKEAKQWNADFVLLEDEDIQIVCNAGQAVTKLVSAKEQMLEIGDKVMTTCFMNLDEADAVVALPHHNMIYDGVQHMDLEKFVNNGGREGSALSFADQQRRASKMG